MPAAHGVFYCMALAAQGAAGMVGALLKAHTPKHLPVPAAHTVRDPVTAGTIAAGMVGALLRTHTLKRLPVPAAHTQCAIL